MNQKIKDFYNSNLGSLSFLSSLFFIFWVIYVFNNWNTHYRNVTIGIISLIPFLILGLLWLFKNLKKLSNLKQTNGEIIDLKASKLKFLFGTLLIILGTSLEILLIFYVMFSPGAGYSLAAILLIFPFIFSLIMFFAGAIIVMDVSTNGVTSKSVIKKPLSIFLTLFVLLLGIFFAISSLFLIFIMFINVWNGNQKFNFSFSLIMITIMLPPGLFFINLALKSFKNRQTKE
jgi:MFS family permease